MLIEYSESLLGRLLRRGLTTPGKLSQPHRLYMVNRRQTGEGSPLSTTDLIHSEGAAMAPYFRLVKRNTVQSLEA